MTQENGRSADEPETTRIPETTPETAATPIPENVPPAPAVPPHTGDTFAAPAEGYPAGPGQTDPGQADAGQNDPSQQYPAPQDQTPQYESPQYPGPQYQNPQYQLPPAGQQYPGGGYQYPAGYAAPGAGYGYQAPPAKTLSLISMVLGIISIATLGSTFFTQIAAVVLGHIALNKEPAGRGMALAGLIMGYVTIGLGILLVILGIIFFAAWAPHISSTYSGAGISV